MADQPAPKPQIDKFRDLARELETDDDEAAFDERLKKLAATKPPPASERDPDAEGVPVTILPTRKAKGALSTSNWSASRIGMRDKAQRVGETKRRATKKFTKPTAPGTKR